MDLSGNWLFYEDFEFGCDRGVAVLRQIGQTVYGTFVYTEHIFNDCEFTIMVEVKGVVADDTVTFNALSYQFVDDEEDVDYFFDDRKGSIVDYDRIEGGSLDDQGIEGRFTMCRVL